MDAEVVYMDSSDRVDFEFDMMNHNVEKNVEMSYGFAAFKNPRDFKGKFEDVKKDKKKIGLAILTALCLFLVIAIIIFLIIYIVVYIKGIEWKVSVLQKVSLSCFFLFVILVVMYYSFNRVFGEMVSLVNVTKQKVV
jgi:hypothetical protein